MSGSDEITPLGLTGLIALLISILILTIVIFSVICLIKTMLPKTSTDAGRIISIKPVFANAFGSICDNLEPDSNVIEESDLHQENHPSPKTSADTGRMPEYHKIPHQER
jgi:hypothetical protein